MTLTAPLPKKEFVALMATLMSMVALSIDAILPALGPMGESLAVANPNDSQLVLSAVFFGMAFGLLVYGPLADSFGRKKSLYLGITIFLIGDMISFFAQDLSLMLLGRVAQGFGAASCRVVTTAMIRDQFEGQQMGRVMALIMVLFILVPALAPSLGQLIMVWFDWRTIFLFMFLVAFGCMLWLHFRQKETQNPQHKRSFSIATIASAMKETVCHPVTQLYIVAAGIVFGAFVGYLSSSQQILQVQFQTGERFPLYFGLLALAIGLSSFVNSKLLLKVKMERLCLLSLLMCSLITSLFLLVIHTGLLEASFAVFLTFLLLVFFCIGILFGNLNTLAVQPLGHIAGTATSVITSIQTLISVVVGASIGALYDGTVIPLVTGLTLCSLLGLFLVGAASKRASQLKS